MKVYFSAAASLYEKNRNDYQRILKVLEVAGLSVIANRKLNQPREYFLSLNEEEKIHLYKMMVHDIEEADICVFDATWPSTLHVGHEISVALERSKVVIAMYKKGLGEPVLFKGIKDSRIIWVEYTDIDLVDELREAICQAKELSNIRFSFFVSPKILTFLDRISKEKSIPRSVYIRTLIEREMTAINEQ